MHNVVSLSVGKDSPAMLLMMLERGETIARTDTLNLPQSWSNQWGAPLSAQLGHSSVVTTGTFYAHVTAGSQQRASRMLPSLTSDSLVTAVDTKEKASHDN